MLDVRIINCIASWVPNWEPFSLLLGSCNELLTPIVVERDVSLNTPAINIRRLVQASDGL